MQRKGDLVLDIHTSEELVVEPKPMELRLRKEVRNLVCARIARPLIVSDERMLGDVLLKNPLVIRKGEGIWRVDEHCISRQPKVYFVVARTL